MGRAASNQLLQKAKKAKSDEFYTQYCDIERELQHYASHFRNKTVYCNCDDPYRSNFFLYFAKNFEVLGLKKLIASCYCEPSAGACCAEGPGEAGYYCEYVAAPDMPFEYSRICVSRFQGDGDFRKTESLNLLRQADIVVTNPPFSLFREFVDQLVKHDKSFLIIGNINAITYKEIFALIQSNRAWLGVNMGRGISGFIVPEGYPLYGTEVSTDQNGNSIIATNNCLWLTNLELPTRHIDIPLSKRYHGCETEYPHYDNCNGINVDRTQDIPRDYAGLMGVPITFLHKYNPEQFEIIRFRKGNDGKDLSIKGKFPYFRILIRNRRPDLISLPANSPAAV